MGWVMNVVRVAAVAALSFSLAGCVVNKDNFGQYLSYARKHPEAVEKNIAACVYKVKYFGIETKRYMAGYAHLAIAQLPDTICHRFAKGYVSGRMKYEDYHALMSRQMFTPNMVRIIRGQ